jgi:1-acyl-sn-glycerol-3-phosphate acyltransferase
VPGIRFQERLANLCRSVIVNELKKYCGAIQPGKVFPWDGAVLSLKDLYRKLELILKVGLPFIETTSPNFMSESPRQSLDGLSLDQRDPQFIESTLMPIWDWFYHHYFPVTSDGWENIPETGKLMVVGSHNGGLASPDMFMAIYDWFRHFGTERPAYALTHPNLWRLAPFLAEAAARCGSLQATAEMAIAALHQEAALLLFPGGLKDVFRPYAQRRQIHFEGNTDFIKLALREEVPIVPLISKGAHDTLIVLTDLYEQVRQFHGAGIPWPFGIDPEVFPIYLGLPWGLGIGPLPNIPFPVPIHIRFGKPITFKHYGETASKDKDYVLICYNQLHMQMQNQLDELMDDY